MVCKSRWFFTQRWNFELENSGSRVWDYVCKAGADNIKVIFLYRCNFWTKFGNFSETWFAYWWRECLKFVNSLANSSRWCCFFFNNYGSFFLFKVFVARVEENILKIFGSCFSSRKLKLFCIKMSRDGWGNIRSVLGARTCVCVIARECAENDEFTTWTAHKQQAYTER